VANWDKYSDVFEKYAEKSFVQIAKSNGIKEATFYSRLNRGMDPEEASTRKPKNGN
jgi:hypothetical protein